MALTSIQRATLNTRLADAESSYHKVMTGQSARVYVDQNGERVEYAAANANRLLAYIQSLKQQLGTLNVTGPMSVWF